MSAPTDRSPIVRSLRSALDGSWAAARDGARKLVTDEAFTPVHGLTLESARDRVSDQTQRIADADAVRVGFPAEYGGDDDIGAWIAMFETLAYADLSLTVKAGVQWGLFTGAIQHLGTERHHLAYLDDAISLRLPGCFAMTETGRGSDVQSLHTTATYDAATQEFVVHSPDPSATKDYIGNAARDGRLAVVFAQLHTPGPGGEPVGHGVHALLVPIRDDQGEAMPGVTIGDCGHKAGLLGVDNGELTFDRVRVPRENLLNRYADVSPAGDYSSSIDNPNRRFFTMLGTLVQGRVSVAGGALSATKLALTIAVRYANTRRQFGAPGRADDVLLLDYRTHQRRLLPALATTYALQFAQATLVTRLHETHGVDDPERRELESRAAGIKAVATWHTTATIQTAREACGGAGYMSENQLPGLKADTDVFTTFEGDNTVLLQTVAKELLTGYREHFGDLDLPGTVRFVTDRVVGTVIERTTARSLIQRLVDAAPGRDEDANLLDRGYQLALMESREEHLLETVAARMKRLADSGAESFDVFNDVQDHLVALARAHVDRVVLEAFVAAVADAETTDPDAAALLDRVCSLHALSTIEADRAWFLEHDRLTPARTKALTAAVNDLCAELRPYADDLVEAFGIPEELITAPIAARHSRSG